MKPAFYQNTFLAFTYKLISITEPIKFNSNKDKKNGEQTNLQLIGLLPMNSIGINSDFYLFRCFLTATSKVNILSLNNLFLAKSKQSV